MYAVAFDLTVADTEKYHPKGVASAYTEIGAILARFGFLNPSATSEPFVLSNGQILRPLSRHPATDYFFPNCVVSQFVNAGAFISFCKPVSILAMGVRSLLSEQEALRCPASTWRSAL
jgi:hypothetical protein